MIVTKPTMIKESMYLLIPKSVANLYSINKNNLFVLGIEQTGKGIIVTFTSKKNGKRKNKR